MPYGGGASWRGDRLWSTEQLVAFMRKLDGCGHAVQQSSFAGRGSDRIEIERSADCTSGPVVFYRVVGAGHEVPEALNVGRVLTDFFREQMSDRAPGPIEARSVKQLFEQYGLLGNFFYDCSKAVGSDNLRIAHRLVAYDKVEREQMSAPTRHDFTMVVDRASELRAGEIAISGTIGTRRFNLVLRVQGMRMRTIESTRDTGERVITGGRFVNRGSEVPWFNKCR